MIENEIATIALDAAFKMHRQLGPGLFESVYETVMEYELINVYKVNVERQKPIPVIWNDIKMDMGFRSDLIIADKIIVELKSIESLAPVHSKQLLTYLRLTDLRLGLLINFNEELLKNGVKRVANHL